MGRKKKIQQYHVTWVTSNYSTVRTVTCNTDLEALKKGLHQEFNQHAHTDDFWIDDLFPIDRPIDDLDWGDLLAFASRLLKENLDLFQEDYWAPYREQFKNTYGPYPHYSDEVVEPILVKPSEYRDFVFAAGHGKYPDTWVEEMTKRHWGHLLTMLERYSADAYFGEQGFARMLSDREINGDFDCDWYGKVFVYRPNRREKWSTV